MADHRARRHGRAGAGAAAWRRAPAHLENAARLQAKGHLLVGGALVDDAGRMIGSACVAQFATRAELDAWLRTDPYVTGRRLAGHPGDAVSGRAALRLPALPRSDSLARTRSALQEALH